MGEVSGVRGGRTRTLIARAARICFEEFHLSGTEHEWDEKGGERTVLVGIQR
jgi:hypothetical protein